jgi:RNA polymerase sigma-70 factor (ECF subfamily)
LPPPTPRTPHPPPTAPVPIEHPDALARAQAGDPDAFEVLYRAHVGRVYALCLRLTGDAQRAEECSQDAFVRAWEGLPAFHGRSAFGTWLHRIAVNAVLAEARAGRRRLARVEPRADEALERLAAAGDEGAPEDRLALEAAVAALPAGPRRAFVLHDVEGYRHDEIASLTGLAAGTLRAQLHRARKLLLQALR